MILENSSVSKLDFAFWITVASLSKPIPVSIFFCGRFFKEPSACLSNWVKTRFQTSRYLSQSQPGPQIDFPHPLPMPVSYNISEQGPQGPVSPICQKFESLPSFMILSFEIIFCHISQASSSSLYTETYSFSLLIFNTSVKNSQLHSIASFLK